MNSQLAALVRGWAPPEALRLLRSCFGDEIRFSGNFASWEQAAAHATGYNAPEILAKAAESTRLVRSREAVFERDSVLFPAPQYPYPLLVGLLRVAAKHGGCLSVVDFGGALGSTYYQCRDFLSGLPAVRWCVVEQPEFVRKGREEFSDEVLTFADSIEDACAAIAPNAILFSGVLQYIPDSWSILQQANRPSVHSIIIDRTPIIDGRHDIIAVQATPKSILTSSYPIRLFTRDSLLSPLRNDYRCLVEFDAVDGTFSSINRPVPFKGFILDRCL